LAAFTAPATTAISTLSLHDALPISRRGVVVVPPDELVGRVLLRQDALGDVVRVAVALCVAEFRGTGVVPVAQMWRHRPDPAAAQDRKSTRLNSSHVKISYAVFCLKK